MSVITMHRPDPGSFEEMKANILRRDGATLSAHLAAAGKAEAELVAALRAVAAMSDAERETLRFALRADLDRLCGANRPPAAPASLHDLAAARDLRAAEATSSP